MREITIKECVEILQLHGFTRSDAHITSNIKRGLIKAEKRYDPDKPGTGHKTRWFVNFGSFCKWLMLKYCFTVDLALIKEYIFDEVVISE